MVLQCIRLMNRRRCLLLSARWHSTSSQQPTSLSTKLPTAGIIVIGDEILKGQVADTNSHFIAKKLYEFGVKLMKISVVSDNIVTVSEEVKKFSNKFKYVFTTGGIGPTHDDITYEAVAMAFNEPLFHHPVLVEICFNFFQTQDIGHPALKLALVPKSSSLLFGYFEKQKSFYPNVNVNNVYIFPGVPQLCERMFNFTASVLFKESNAKFHIKEIYTSTAENNFLHFLNRAVALYSNVSFGSYPEFFHSYYSVRVTMESLSEAETLDAYNYLKNTLPVEYLLDYDREPYENKSYKLNKLIEALNNENLSSTVNSFKELCRQYKPDEISLFLDGGKNSTLILHLFSTIISDIHPQHKLDVLYVQHNIDKLIDKHIDACEKNYNINLMKLKYSLEKSLHIFKLLNSNIKVLIKGTRDSDPMSNDIKNSFNTKHFEICNPLANWSYHEVWLVLRSLFLPYCKLYDKGFTSISTKHFRPNPYLATEGFRKDIVYYKKAHELEDATLEDS